MRSLPTRYFRNAFFLSLVAFFSMTALSQVAITGRITGVVVDKTGATVPGASIEVEGAALMHPRTVQTQAGGAYLVEQLPPGEYKITCSRPDFETFIETGVMLTAGFTATVNVTMQLGSTTQTVDVSGSGPVVDVEGSSPPTTFDTNLLQNIPSGHDPWSTVAQVPGVTTSTFDVGGNQSAQQSSMSIHGAPRRGWVHHGSYL